MIMNNAINLKNIYMAQRCVKGCIRILKNAMLHYNKKDHNLCVVLQQIQYIIGFIIFHYC